MIDISWLSRNATEGLKNVRVNVKIVKLMLKYELKGCYILEDLSYFCILHQFGNFSAHYQANVFCFPLCYKEYSPNIDTVRLWFLHVISSQDTQSVIFQIVVFHRNLHFNIVVPLTGSCAVVLYCDFTTTEL